MRQLARDAHLRRLSTVISPGQWTAIATKLRLTPRQSQVVHLALQAKRDKEIAEELELSVTTVRMHLRYAYRHLGVNERMELAVLVFASIEQLPAPLKKTIASASRDTSRKR